MKIAAHTLVKNEGRFVWYSVMSVARYVDKIYLWDTGSTDSTPEILKAIKSKLGNKVDLKFLNSVDVQSFAEARQQMLDATAEDWFIMLDADEIWWDRNMAKLTAFIRQNGKKYESVVVPTINLVGDMYHYQEEKAGLYKLAGRVGHYNLRAVNRNIPGLKSDKPHGTWGWVDNENKMIQDRDSKKIKFLDLPYIHATFLQRSDFLYTDKSVPKRAKKYKYELGEKFSRDFYYPEVFFRQKPSFVPNVWLPRSRKYYAKSLWQTPLRKLKRRCLPTKVGY